MCFMYSRNNNYRYMNVFYVFPQQLQIQQCVLRISATVIDIECVLLIQDMKIRVPFFRLVVEEIRNCRISIIIISN